VADIKGPERQVKAQTGVSGSAVSVRIHAGRYRYLVVAVIWLAFFFGGFDRAAISLLLTDPGFLREMGLEGSPERQGLLMTFLLLPYALSNILLGPTADHWGPRKVLTLMTGFWAVAAIWMGATGSYFLMLVGRVVRGTAEGPLFPVANRYIRFWFPLSERGGANAIWTSGQRVGMTLAVPLLSVAIGMWGWRSAFYLQAVFVLILVVPSVWFLGADAPENRVGIGVFRLSCL
jgi:ACS family glucarate transporter-like MFS transporter